MSRPTGIALEQRAWTPAEIEVVDRYARALADGNYRSTYPAAIDCARELAERAERDPALPARTFVAVRRYLNYRCHDLGLQWSTSFWTKDELNLARDHAQAFIEGRFPTIRDAARECLQRLAADPECRRTLDGTCWHIAREVRKLGIPAHEKEYTAAETEVLERHARLLYTGGMRSITEAVKSCRRALGGHRTAMALRERLKTMIEGKELPRTHGFMVDSELQVIEEYVHKVAAGEIPTWRDAAGPCYEELQRLQSELADAAPDTVSRNYGRDVMAVYGAIIRMAQRLGLRQKLKNRWTEEEERLCENWRQWYHKYRNVHRLKPLTQAGEGLQEELAALGFKRTLTACAQHIAKYRRSP